MPKLLPCFLYWRRGKAGRPKSGFGLMRLSMDGDVIDIEKTKEIADRFMEAGFRYFGTAYGYNDGESEKAAKVALVDRYPRESFLFATKVPVWAGAESKEEVQQMFYTSLDRTGAGYGDCGFYPFRDVCGLFPYFPGQRVKGKILSIPCVSGRISGGLCHRVRVDALSEGGSKRYPCGNSGRAG